MQGALERRTYLRPSAIHTLADRSTFQTINGLPGNAPVHGSNNILQGFSPYGVERQADPRLASSLKRIGDCQVPVEQTSTGFRYGGAWVVDVPSYLAQLAPWAPVVEGEVDLRGTTITTVQGVTTTYTPLWSARGWAERVGARGRRGDGLR
ncbi:MAG: hypothetical protein R3E66_09125 [bacterium]